MTNTFTIPAQADLSLLDALYEVAWQASGSLWEQRLYDVFEDMLERMLNDGRDAGAVTARLQRGAFRKPSEVIKQLGGEL